jgi:SAM-dependent methyltransferase
MFGVEKILPLAIKARDHFDVALSNLEAGIGLSSGSVDVVSANQVIEHVVNVDAFVDECNRLLKPGGVAVISTENLAAWPNVVALALGSEPFSTNYSKRFYGVGNRFSRRQLTPIERGYIPHNSVPTFAALRHLFELADFTLIDTAGVHVVPLPNRALYALRQLGSRRSFYLSLTFRKRD